jgi:VIT1/CCC1 family predicted Fe2+/Mn2+ transporter
VRRGGLGLLIAPSIQHRIVFRTQDKEHLVVRANQLVIAGTALLAVAMTGAIWLVAGYLFRDWLTAVAVVIVAALFATLWFGVPLLRLRQDR